MIIAVIIIGYVSDSMDDGLLSRLDINTIRWFQKVWGYNKSSGCQDLLRRTLPGLPSAHYLKSDTKGRRNEVLTKFVLSDQQLVTGLAFLIAALSQQRRLNRLRLSSRRGSLLVLVHHASGNIGCRTRLSSDLSSSAPYPCRRDGVSPNSVEVRIHTLSNATGNTQHSAGPVFTLSP